MKKDAKTEVVKIRLSEYTYRRVKEAAYMLGLNQSTLMRMGVERLMSEVYSNDGRIRHEYRERAKQLGCYRDLLHDDPCDTNGDG